MVRFARSIGYSFAFALLTLCNPPAANAEFVVAYRAVSTDLSGNATGPAIAPATMLGVTGQNLAIGSGVTAINVTPDVFTTRQWTNQALDASDYLSFGFTASAKPVALTNIELNLASSADGPGTGELQASFDGGTTFQNIGTDANFSISKTGPERRTIDLTRSSLDFSQVSSVEFRLFAYDADNSGNPSQLNVHNFTEGVGDGFGIFVGGIQAVPEPTSLALIGVCAAGAGFRWRAKRRGAAANQQPRVG